MNLRIAPLDERSDAFARVLGVGERGLVGRECRHGRGEPVVEIAPRRGLRRLHGERGHRGDLLGELERARELGAARHDLLHEADPARLFRAELVAGEQVVHRVAPPAALDEADRGAARGVDAALRLELREAAVVGGDDDVAGQHHLDARGVGDPVHRGDDRLAARARERHRVDAVAALAFAPPAAVLHPLGPLREVEPRGEMLAVAEQHAHPELGILVEARVGEAELAHHLRRQAVVLLAPVEPHQEDPAALLDADLAVGMSLALAHCDSSDSELSDHVVRESAHAVLLLARALSCRRG